MSQPIRIPPQARATADALVQFCVKAGVNYEFLPMTGSGHPLIKMEFGRQSRKMTFASTPSDRRRGALNAVSQARRLCREMGWQKPSKEQPVTYMIPQSMSKFDAQRPSTGPASECTITRPSNIQIPPPIGDQVNINWTRWSDEQRARRVERDAAIAAAQEARHPAKDIHKALVARGWTVKLSSVTALATQYRQSLMLQAKPAKAEPKARPAPQAKSAQRFEIDDLALEIARAIAPIIAAQLDGVEDLRAKAEKWEAIKGLVSDA